MWKTDIYSFEGPCRYNVCFLFYSLLDLGRDSFLKKNSAIQKKIYIQSLVRPGSIGFLFTAAQKNVPIFCAKKKRQINIDDSVFSTFFIIHDSSKCQWIINEYKFYKITNHVVSFEGVLVPSSILPISTWKYIYIIPVTTSIRISSRTFHSSPEKQ